MQIVKEFIRKIAFWVAEKTTDSIFDSEVLAMKVYRDSLYIITKNGTLYEKKGDTMKIHRSTVTTNT